MKIKKTFERFNLESINEGQFSWLTYDTDVQIGSEKQNTIDVYMFDNEGNQWHEKKYDGYGVFGNMDYYELLAKMNGFTEEDLEDKAVLKAIRAMGKAEMRDIGITLAFEPKKIKTKAKGNKVLFPVLVENPKFAWKRHDFTEEAESDPNQSWYQEPEYDDYEDDEDYEEGWYESAFVDFKGFLAINEARQAPAKTLFKMVVKGSTSEIEGVKISKDMAQAALDWFDGSVYARKYEKQVKTAGIGVVAPLIFGDNWGIKKRIPSKLKAEFKELQTQYKRVRPENESVVKMDKEFAVVFAAVHEASRRKVHKAAKQGSYPAVIVVVQDGKVIHQEPVSTPDVAPATFNVMQEKYPKALLHLEDNTGKRLFSESIVNEASDASLIKKLTDMFDKFKLPRKYEIMMDSIYGAGSKWAVLRKKKEYREGCVIDTLYIDGGSNYEGYIELKDARSGRPISGKNRFAADEIDDAMEAAVKHVDSIKESNNIDRLLSNMDESKQSDELAIAINSAIVDIDDSMSYVDFAQAVGKVIRDEYGTHLYKEFKKEINKSLKESFNELRSTPLSGTMAGSTQSLEDRKYKLKKDVKGARIGDFVNVTLPKGTIIYNLPGGLFADHFSLKSKYTTSYGNGPKWLSQSWGQGVSIRQMPDILDAIEKNSKVLESAITENRMLRKGQFKFGAKLQYGIEDVNESYGFYGTLTNQFGLDEVNELFLDGFAVLDTNYDFTDQAALYYLNSKAGRWVADQVIEKLVGAKNMSPYYGHLEEIFAEYAKKGQWKKWAKEYDQFAEEDNMEEGLMIRESRSSKDEYYRELLEAEQTTNDQSPLGDGGMETGIKNKAKESGVPVGLLRIIMRRGLAAWKTGHRPGATQAQWGYARVNSFLTKQPGTWGKADSDIAKKVRDGGHDKEL